MRAWTNTAKAVIVVIDATDAAIAEYWMVDPERRVVTVVGSRKA